jgi:Flp pilus assembly pilin Flp
LAEGKRIHLRGYRGHLVRLWADDSGISSAEYALLLAFIGGGVIMAVDSLSTAVSDELFKTAACFDGVADANGGQGGGTGAGARNGGGSGQGTSNGGGFSGC